MRFQLFFAVLLASCISGVAQDNSNFTHSFMNPYLLNPSYAGTDGRAFLSATYRKQWVDIEGAPTIGNFTFHTPTGKNVGFGLSVTNAERSILNTTSGYLTTSYALSFSDKVALRFGFSVGAASNSVDIDEFTGSADPALNSLLDQNLYLIGNAGLSFQIHHFNIGAALPNIFTDEYAGEEDFTQGEVEPLENLILTASNRFYLDRQGKFIFEPFLIYRYSDVLPAQFEGTGIFHINNIVWLGGTYKQDFGISGFGGLKVNKVFALGYAYSLANTGANEINSPTHEIHLSMILGVKNKKRLVYSFVDTSIPEKKSKKQIAQEKRQAAAEERKRQREEQAKIAEEKRLEEERIEEEKRKEEERKVEEDRKLAEEKAAEEAKEEEVQPIIEETEPVEEEEPEEEPTPRPEGNLNAQQSTEERVIVKSGDHLLELSTGEYVVVGVFSDYEGAEKFSDQLFFKGYQSKFGYISEKGFWYVYVDKMADIEAARSKRDELRKSAFPNAWVLTVQ